MQGHEGDPLRLFLAFLEPLSAIEPAKPAWNPPDGEEVLLADVRGPTSVFARGRTITSGGADDEDVVRGLPPAA